MYVRGGHAVVEERAGQGEAGTEGAGSVGEGCGMQGKVSFVLRNEKVVGGWDCTHGPAPTINANVLGGRLSFCDMSV